jgi:Kef-type K+ transport system membrane component KefB
MNNLQLAVQFFAQIAIILVFCRIVGVIAKRFGQPQVVAEMIAGVMLGPSLFGLYFPDFQQWIFPWDSSKRDTQSYLFPASQLGLALYMFVVGMEFRVDIVRAQLKCSIAVSLAGMIAPFLLGAGLGWLLFEHSSLIPKEVSQFEAMVFLGASMCITAFPMLARIIHFKGLAGTTMGTVAIGAGAIDDATAWCLLAVVLGSFDQNYGQALLNIVGGISFLIVSIGVIRPILTRVEKYLVEENQITETGIVVCLALMATAAWFTDYIGLHAVFGAFVMGTVMPRQFVSKQMIEKIQPLTVVLLLPLFFTYSGLNTKIGLLNSPSLLGYCILVLLAAMVGKGIACWLAALATGLPNREAMGIGTLMNARGLMELIIINIGRERGIISDEMFAMLVIMAVITTLMASPLFDWLVGSGYAVESIDRPSSESS